MAHRAPEHAHWLENQIGVYLPPDKLTNQDIAAAHPNGKNLTAEAIYRKTGVRTRSLANGQDLIGLAVNAYAQLWEQPEQVDALFFITSYPNGRHLSTDFADAVGLEVNYLADVYYACSGFVKSFQIIKQNEPFFLGKKVMFVASEIYSTTVPNLMEGEIDDSMSQTIFTDGASVFSFTYGQELRVLSDASRYYSNHESAAILTPFDRRLVPNQHHVSAQIPPPSPDGRFRMIGRDVYRTMAPTVPLVIEAAINRGGTSKESIDLVISHQASRSMIDGIASRTTGLENKFYSDLEEGNLSSGSILKALYRAAREGAIGSGSKIVFAGFGAGLYTGAAVVEFG